MGLFSSLNIQMKERIFEGIHQGPHDSKLQQQRNLPSIKTNHQNIHCFVPSKTIHISTGGHIYLCGCGVFLPFKVANILDLKSFDDLYDLSMVKKIINSIDDRTYEYCDTNACGVKEAAEKDLSNWPIEFPEHYRAMDGTRLWSGQLADINETFISVGMDESCNLQCPSCRLHTIDWNKSTSPKYANRSKEAQHELSLLYKRQYNELVALHNHLIPLINNYNKHALIEFGGTGDAFYSLITTKFISKLEYNPLHRYKFKTNGLCMKAILPKLKILPTIYLIDISIDAATKETHEKLRVGSNWEKLIDNIKWLVDLPNRPKVEANFTIQNENFREIKKFKELMIDEIGIDYVHYSRYEKWGHISEDLYKENAVHLPEHPNNEEFNNIKKDRFWDIDTASRSVVGSFFLN